MKRTQLALLAVLLGTTVAPSVQADPVVAPIAPVVGPVVVPKPMIMTAEKRKAAYTTALRSFSGNVVIPAASQWSLMPGRPVQGGAWIQLMDKGMWVLNNQAQDVVFVFEPNSKLLLGVPAVGNKTYVLDCSGSFLSATSSLSFQLVSASGSTVATVPQDAGHAVWAFRTPSGSTTSVIKITIPSQYHFHACEITKVD
jgi:hypothetical protein